MSAKKPIRRKPLVEVEPLNWVAPDQRKEVEEEKSSEQSEKELTAQA